MVSLQELLACFRILREFVHAVAPRCGKNVTLPNFDDAVILFRTVCLNVMLFIKCDFYCL